MGTDIIVHILKVNRLFALIGRAWSCVHQAIFVGRILMIINHTVKLKFYVIIIDIWIKV